MPHPCPEYPDAFDYIRDAEVRKAFVYLVEEAQRIPGYTARPKPHGYISRNLHYFDTSDRDPYAFTVNQKWLLFYMRMPDRTHPNITPETIREHFAEVNLLKDGQITFRVRNVDDARAAMQLLFPKALGIDGYSFPDEIAEDTSYAEGTVTEVRVNSYERNPHARAACIKHYGYSCAVCGFNFADTYGPLGENFIHVHHLVELSSTRAQYNVDPIRDLRPVCPNYHAMLHRTSPALTIDELRKNLTRRST